VHETADDLDALQSLLDASLAAGGEHLRSILTPDRQIPAEALVGRLTGMTLLTLATVSRDGRPFVGPVDGVFHRGAFHFGSSPDSLRFRHIAKNPAVSATYLPREEFAVTVHGTAVPVDVRAPEHAGFRSALLEVYTPRYGSEWEQFLDGGPVYARIDAAKMFVLSMD
jgi:uncharacterized pyridoxamine 5'-phosphate oxidase family protein